MKLFLNVRTIKKTRIDATPLTNNTLFIVIFNAYRNLNRLRKVLCIRCSRNATNIHDYLFTVCLCVFIVSNNGFIRFVY